MAKIRRDIEIEPPRFPVVSPEGLIKMVAVAGNIRGALEIGEAGIVLSRYHERQGWQLLQTLYQNEGRIDLWEAWQGHQAAHQAARRYKHSIDSFPAEYLPAEVQRRRAGARPNATVWKMPTLSPIKVDAPADKPARAPKPDAVKKEA